MPDYQWMLPLPVMTHQLPGGAINAACVQWKDPSISNLQDLIIRHFIKSEISKPSSNQQKRRRQDDEDLVSGPWFYDPVLNETCWTSVVPPVPGRFRSVRKSQWNGANRNLSAETFTADHHSARPRQINPLISKVTFWTKKAQMLPQQPNADDHLVSLKSWWL